MKRADTKAKRQLALAGTLGEYVRQTSADKTLDELVSTRKLLQSRFISGIVNGLLTVLGIAIALSLAGGLLSVIGDNTDGSVSDFAKDTEKKIDQQVDQR